MKTTFLYIPVLCLVLFASCKKKFLDKAPSVNLPEEEVFTDPVLASQYADNAYNFLVNDYARMNDHRGITGQAADEAVSGNNDVSVRTLSQGAYHDHYERGGEPNNDIRDVYVRCYSGIRIANVMLSKNRRGTLDSQSKPTTHRRGDAFSARLPVFRADKAFRWCGTCRRSIFGQR